MMPRRSKGETMALTRRPLDQRQLGIVVLQHPFSLVDDRFSIWFGAVYNPLKNRMASCRCIHIYM
jgi:hypothetical protein